jgi:hypothetical protein
MSNTESKLTEIGLKETERNKALPAVGSVIDHAMTMTMTMTTTTKINKLN